ncbi:MAG: DNA-processing protein DprA [bacterium]
MSDIQQYAYWMALAHLPKWRTEKINRLIVEILHERKMSFPDFFEGDQKSWSEEFHLNSNELNDLDIAKTELPNYSFLVEDLLNQGFEIIPIDADDYSPTLKNNLKLKYAPPLLYTKGNKSLLKESSIAIVGSRNASDISLEFTKNIAKNTVKNFQVVVSGFAKGVDRTALEETLSAYGRSIIVLPQGIMTFASGFKKYYSRIIEGDVLVLSAYHPKAPWSVGLAMGRNAYIYGLADKIYVAESDVKGGTWSGVVDGLRKNREIYVRKSNPGENNANDLLILKGAAPVNIDGDIVKREGLENFEEQVKNVLSSKPLTVREIKDKIHIDIDTRKLSSMLSELTFVVMEKDNGKNRYRLKNSELVQTNLFNSRDI